MAKSTTRPEESYFANSNYCPTDTYRTSRADSCSSCSRRGLPKLLLPIVLMMIGATAIQMSGCRKAETPAKPPAASNSDNRSVFKQAIDKAHDLEKQINDRAIDPGEKARLGGPDPTEPDQGGG